MPDSDHDPLPPSAALARRLADQRAILRLVGHDEPVEELPPTSEGLMEPPSGTGKEIRNGVLLALLSAAFVWLVTVNAWDHDGFFPWFWNVIWALFPWVFLAPMWTGYFRSLRRSRDNAPIYAQYHRDRKAAVRTTGTVHGVRHRPHRFRRCERVRRPGGARPAHDDPHAARPRAEPPAVRGAAAG